MKITSLEIAACVRVCWRAQKIAKERRRAHGGTAASWKEQPLAQRVIAILDETEIALAELDSEGHFP